MMKRLLIYAALALVVFSFTYDNKADLPEAAAAVSKAAVVRP